MNFDWLVHYAESPNVPTTNCNLQYFDLNLPGWFLTNIVQTFQPLIMFHRGGEG